MKNSKPILVVFSGAGISAESGLKTFRDTDGLWEGHSIYEVATPQGWEENPQKVLDFYNERRKQLLNAKPNAAHHAIAALESKYEVYIITQNVDDLHERANSSRIVHLHGELLKSRSIEDPDILYDCRDNIKIGDTGMDGGQLRPHVVWFGESVNHIDISMDWVRNADILLVIGTSLQVYPAASLIGYCKREIPVYYIDPNPSISFELQSLKDQLILIKENAVNGMQEFQRRIQS
jgi:NAD-dependent deacetylase